MKIGVYINSITPRAGGASTLLTTIRNALQEQRGNYQYVILYSGKFWGEYRTESDGLTYININAGKRKAYLQFVWRKLVNTGKNFIRLFSFDGSYPYFYSYLDQIAKVEQIDLIWFTYPVCIKTSVPYIFTMWDLGHHVLPMVPEVNCDWQDRERMCQEMLPHASWIIIGNETGKQEILNSYSVTPDKIRIVPFPVSSFCDGPSERPGFLLPEKYFFYPAQFWAHKNHIVIINALKILKKKYNLCPKVYFTGADKGNKKYIEDQCVRLGVQDQVDFLGFLSYEELKYMYLNATAMVFASLMGPNNLPPIEAAYLGCPVIISGIPGHVEQMGDCALFFDGTNEAELADAMYRVYTNESGIRDQLKEKMKNADFSCDYLQHMYSVFDEYEKILRTWKQTM